MCSRLSLHCKHQTSPLATNVSDAVTSLFGYGEEKEPRKTLVLQKEEFEPAVFQLCGQNKKVNAAQRHVCS